MTFKLNCSSFIFIKKKYKHNKRSKLNEIYQNDGNTLEEKDTYKKKDYKGFIA